MSWHSDRLKNQRKGAEVVGCPKCGATGDDPCRTPSGKVAKKQHKERG